MHFSMYRSLFKDMGSGIVICFNYTSKSTTSGRSVEPLKFHCTVYFLCEIGVG